MSKKGIISIYLLELVITTISLLCLKNSIIQFIVTIFLSTRTKLNNKKITKITLFCTLFNTFCGKLTILCNILLFIDIILWITADIKRQDLLKICDDLVIEKNIKKKLITLLYFDKYYKKNKKSVELYHKKLDKSKKIKKTIEITNNDLFLLKEELEKRLFFNQNKPQKIYKLKKETIIRFMTILIFFITTIMLGGSTYALFN